MYCWIVNITVGWTFPVFMESISLKLATPGAGSAAPKNSGPPKRGETGTIKYLLKLEH